MSIYTLTIWLHIVAATAWIGSMIFFAAVIVPVLRRPEQRATAGVLLRALGKRYRALGWVSLAVLVATGIANLSFHGIGFGTLMNSDFRASGFGRALTWKLLLVVLVVSATALHDVLTGARAQQAMLRDPTSPEAQRARRVASWLGRVTLLLSLGVLFFAVALVRGMP